MLAEAVSSVLKQSQKSLELIVVDDCSTDGTEEYVKSINDSRVKYVRNEKNSGQGISRREGFRNARGKYVSFLDDDDYYTDYDFYAKAVKILDEHENDDVPVVMVCSNAQILWESTGKLVIDDLGAPGRVKGIDYTIKPEYGRPISVFSAVFRADALRRAGFYDEPIFDANMYVKAALEGDAWLIPDISGLHIIHSNSISLGFKKHKADNERHYNSVRAFIRITAEARDELYKRISRKETDGWYIPEVIGFTDYFAVARPGIKDRLKTIRIVLSESGFMPKLWLGIFLKLCSKLLFSLPRKIYRRIRSRNKN